MKQRNRNSKLVIEAISKGVFVSDNGNMMYLTTMIARGNA
jgi:hypothetical protein